MMLPEPSQQIPEEVVVAEPQVGALSEEVETKMLTRQMSQRIRMEVSAAEARVGALMEEVVAREAETAKTVATAAKLAAEER
eukprot:182427-Prorocentrum_minimum.AAC.1